LTLRCTGLGAATCCVASAVQSRVRLQAGELGSVRPLGARRKTTMRGFWVLILAIGYLLVAGCDPAYEYRPEDAVSAEPFPVVTVTPAPTIGLLGSYYFSPPILVQNRAAEEVQIVAASVKPPSGARCRSAIRGLP